MTLCDKDVVYRSVTREKCEITRLTDNVLLVVELY